MLENDDKIGDYSLVKFLGKGQFGEVWLATKQVAFSKRKFKHALKFLSSPSDELDLNTVESEIDSWIEASGHPNVMPVLDMLTHQGHLVIVSEYAEGGSLKKWLKENGGKASSIERALELILGILNGIEHLHSRHVVHRDLKPDNILLQGKFPRITDFGISRIVSDGAVSTQVLGTPAYMSPESFSGDKAPQTDIWSAGVILFEMLSGNKPFKGDTIYDLARSIQQNDPIKLPASISFEISAIVDKALQKDVTKRFQTAKEMRNAIERALHEIKVKTGQSDNQSRQLVNSVFIPASANFANDQLEETALSFSELNETQTVQAFKAKGEQIDKTIAWHEIRRHNQSDDGKGLSGQVPILENFGNESTYKGGKKIKDLTIMGLTALTVLVVTGFIIYKAGLIPPQLTANTLSDNLSNKQGNPETISKTNPPEGMAYVPSGEFTMGRDSGKNEEEKPAHKVSVNAFFIDLTEVTNEKYAEFVKAAKHPPPTEWNNGAPPKGQEKFPVVGVAWDDANAYAKWVGKRLPTEEEWEFAARGTNNFLYPWGDEWKQGNANANSQSQTFSEVGKFTGKSPFGLYDMVGNAWEWTSSDFKGYPNSKLSISNTGKGNLKAIRGGSFEGTKDFATTTYRIGWESSGAQSYSRTGFRCVKDIEK